MVYKNTDYQVRYRNIKYPRLELKTGTLELILPHGESPMDLIENHKHWIIRKQQFIKNSLKDSQNRKTVNRTDKMFKELISDEVKNFTKQLKVKVSEIFYRKMRTKWASCSSKRNLTINTLMKYLPKKQIKYIIYHELTHLHEKRHNERFWKLITRKFKNYQRLEYSLFSYWFLLSKLKGGETHGKKNNT